MSYKQQKELINKLKKELAEAEAALAEQVNNIVPQHGATYYTIIDVDIQRDEYDAYDIDKCRLKYGAVFMSEIEAEEELERRKLLQEIKVWRFKNDPNGVDWADHNLIKFNIFYDHSASKFHVAHNTFLQYFGFYFSSKVNAQEFIAYFGDRLKLLLT